MCLILGLSTCLAWGFRSGAWSNNVRRMESSSRGFGAYSGTAGRAGDNSLEIGIRDGAGFGRFFLTPVMLLRLA